MNEKTKATGAPPPSLDRDALQQFIDRHRIDAAILNLNEHTATVADAARALEVETDQIIKSLVFRHNDDALLVIASGLARVDRKKLAAFLGVGRKKVKFANPEEVLRITGYVVGSMPPFGHRTRLRTLIDTEVTGLGTVFGGGGSLNTMMRLTPDELLRVTGAEVVSVCEDSPEISVE
ncbi:MAG: YbaK/EbsC family protein [Desulfobacterales bacterium]|nr:YbaK/EbsC family protein [Desulfobacterales bacterium]